MLDAIGKAVGSLFEAVSSIMSPDKPIIEQGEDYYPNPEVLAAEKGAASSLISRDGHHPQLMGSSVVDLIQNPTQIVEGIFNPPAATPPGQPPRPSGRRHTA